MRIIDKTKKGRVSFSGVPVGGVFCEGDAVFMKLGHFRVAGTSYNTVKLQTGEVFIVCNSDMVTPVIAELVITNE